MGSPSHKPSSSSNASSSKASDPDTTIPSPVNMLSTPTPNDDITNNNSNATPLLNSRLGQQLDALNAEIAVSTGPTLTALKQKQLERTLMAQEDVTMDTTTLDPQHLPQEKQVMELGDEEPMQEAASFSPKLNGTTSSSSNNLNHIDVANHTQTNTTSTLTPIHKRARESTFVADPNEMARYTPPREMFRSESSSQDEASMASSGMADVEDNLVQIDDGDEDDMSLSGSDQPRSRRVKQRTPHHQQRQPPPPPPTSHQLQQQQQQQEDADDEFDENGRGRSVVSVSSEKTDSEINQMGQKLSIHSPEKPTSLMLDPSSSSLSMSLSTVADGDQDLQSQEQQNEVLDAAPSFADQLEIIQNLHNAPLIEGASWYLINNEWAVRFRKYCNKKSRGEEATSPGPIDNSVLFEGRPENGKLKAGMNGFYGVPQEGWDLVKSWYGIITPPIVRTVVNTATPPVSNLTIDIYPIIVPVYLILKGSDMTLLSSPGSPPQIQFSRSTSMGQLLSKARTLLSVESKSRLWCFTSFLGRGVTHNAISANTVAINGGVCLEKVDTLATAAEISELLSTDALGLELTEYEPLTNAPAPASITMSTYGSSTTATSFTPSRIGFSGKMPLTNSVPSAPVEGICGLVNLGNTCFMNSALQCLSNTPDLTRYFLSGAWHDELNPSNPLGMEGEVAKAFAVLLDKLWNGTSKSFPPREFKSTIGRFAPQFTGYQQHDSQELLAFLLDGLHEDLNRIKKKPYTEVPDSNGRPDEEVAKDCWEIHKARNDSIIVDLFQGQYKSTLVCPKCSKVSVTFDPFMYLSLPLPITKKWVGKVVYVPYDPRLQPFEVKVQLPKGSSMKQLKARVGELVEAEPSCLFAAEVFSNSFYKVYENHDPVEEIGASDIIYMYEVGAPDFLTSTEFITFPVYTQLEDNSNRPTYGKPPLLGVPMMVTMSVDDAKDPDAVYEEIMKHVQRYTTAPLFEDIEDQPGERRVIRELFEMKVNPPSVRKTFRNTIYHPFVSNTHGALNLEDLRIRAANHGRVSSPIPSPTLSPALPSSHGNWRSPSPPLALPWPSVNATELSVGWPDYSTDTDIPPMDEIEISEEEDPATLQSGLQPKRTHASSPVSPASTASPTEEPSAVTDVQSGDLEVEPEVVPEVPTVPAVRLGESVYCIWGRQAGAQIFKGSQTIRSTYRMTQYEEDSESEYRALWHERGAPVVDPELQAEMDEALGMGSKKAKKDISLYDCLNEYTREEKLGEEDLWYCPNCKEHQQATKKLDIWRLPDILVVHLKRFSHTRIFRDKIDAVVDFPIQGLDLSGKALQTVEDSENVYDLFGVSNHMGGLGGGHYTAYAKNEKQNRWFNFDDSSVSPVSNVENIKSSSAYLLFYRRRNAQVREYEQRTVVLPTSPSKGFASSSSRLRSYHRGFDDDDDDDFSRQRRPFGPQQPLMALTASSDAIGFGASLHDADEEDLWDTKVPMRSINPPSDDDNDIDADEPPSYNDISKNMGLGSSSMGIGMGTGFRYTSGLGAFSGNMVNSYSGRKTKFDPMYDEEDDSSSPATLDNNNHESASPMFQTSPMHSNIASDGSNMGSNSSSPRAVDYAVPVMNKGGHRVEMAADEEMEQDTGADADEDEEEVMMVGYRNQRRSFSHALQKQLLQQHQQQQRSESNALGEQEEVFRFGGSVPVAAVSKAKGGEEDHDDLSDIGRGSSLVDMD